MNLEMIDFLWDKFQENIRDVITQFAAFIWADDEVEVMFSIDVLFCAFEDLPNYIGREDSLSKHIIKERFKGHNIGNDGMLIPYLINESETIKEKDGSEEAYDCFLSLKNKMTSIYKALLIIEEGLRKGGNDPKANIVKNWNNYIKMYIPEEFL